MYIVRFVLFCADAVNDFLGKNCPHVAGAISFYTLFSLFPLTLAVISIAGFVLGPNAEETQLAKDLATIIPISAEFIGDTLQGVVRARTITGITSIVGLIWAATAAFSAVRKGINAAWGVKKTRPFLKERMMDLGLVVGTGLLMVFLLFVSPMLAFFKEITNYIAPDASIATDLVWGIVALLFSPVLSFLGFLVLYRYLPNSKVTFNDVWLGALVASIVFDGAKWGFVWYVKTFPVYNFVYGSIGAIMALLTWVYVSAIILLFGALVTSRYATYRAKTTDAEGIRIIWNGLTRVRLRVVASTEAG